MSRTVMRKTGYFILTLLVIYGCLWVLKREQSSPLETGTESRAVEPSHDRGPQSGADQTTPGQAWVAYKAEENEAWLKSRSAGLVILQAFDPESNEPRGSVTSGNLTADLGETPPVYRHQLQTSGCPIMLGEKHQKRSYVISATSLSKQQDIIGKKYPLRVIYPRWPGAGLETSGGFVFMKNEIPLTTMGVILPNVTPSEGLPGEADLLEWQIIIRINSRQSDFDPRTKAKPQSLGPEVVVLMPTHPDKIPASASVVWVKFEKDGTVSLMED